MDKKIKELVKEAAQQIWHDEYERSLPLVEVSWDMLPEWATNAYLNTARKILSHPGLCLVDMKKATSIDNQYLGKLWVIAQEHAIPLADALKVK